MIAAPGSGWLAYDVLQKMKKTIPWFGGILIGCIISALIAGILIVRDIFAEKPDPTYELVAVSWGAAKADSSGRSIYQIKVIARDHDKDGILDVTAKGCIGSSSYYHDFGSLGTAANMSEATRNYGIITWEDDKVTIGGNTGIKSSVMRSQLEKHR